MALFSTLALAALLSLFSTATAAFSAASKTNVAVYWGQGAYQARLLETCKNPNIDIVILGFINVFPDNSDSGGYPGSNFGNACNGVTYKNKTGGTTQLLSGCRYIGPDIKACQKSYGKKVLLSLGGGYPTNYFIGGPARAVEFAEFMWGAFGPLTASWNYSKNPRPFGDAVVDGFDFDIESSQDPLPVFKGKSVNDYKTRGYARMIQTLKNQLFPLDKSKTYYISGAPECEVPDAHLGTVVQQAWFDFLFIQFYNTPYCSARTGFQHIQGKTTRDISFNTWADVKFYNPNIKLYIGLPASTNASGSTDFYLPPQDANTLLSKFYSNAKFGGVMLWEATHGMNNIVCGKNYQTWIKRILTAISNKKPLKVVTNDCPTSGDTCGKCATIAVTTNGRCGANYGTTCTGSKFGSCCDDGKCSNATAACSSSCDSRFSKCDTVSKYAQVLKQQYKRQEAISANLEIQASVSASLSGGVSTPASLPMASSDLPTSEPSPSSQASASSNSLTADVPGNGVATPAPASSVALESSPSVTLGLDDLPRSSDSIAPASPNSSAASAGTPTATQLADPPTLAPNSTSIPAASSVSSSAVVPYDVPSTLTEANTTPVSTEIDAPVTVPQRVQASATVIIPSNTATSEPVTVRVTPSTTTETVFQTILRTVVEENITKTVTIVEPVTTTTIVVDVTVTEFETPAAAQVTQDPAVPEPITTTTVTSCDSSDPSCTSSRKTLTVVVTTTLLTHSTVTIPPRETRKTITLYSTDVVTRTIELNYNPDRSLYNPHSASTRTEFSTRTETINTTILVTPMTTTQKSTTTVVEFVTIVPVAVQGKDAINVAGNKVKGGEASLAKGAVTSEGSLAATSAAVQQQTANAGGRLSPRDNGSWTPLMASMVLCLAMMML